MPPTKKLHTGGGGGGGMYMWQLRFNNKMQSSLDRLNLGPGLAKNKTKGKEDKREKKANKKGEESYKTGA